MTDMICHALRQGVAIPDFERHEAEHGALPEGAIVLLDTGFAARWPQREPGFCTPTSRKWEHESRRMLRYPRFRSPPGESWMKGE